MVELKEIRGKRETKFEEKEPSWRGEKKQQQRMEKRGGSI